MATTALWIYDSNASTSEINAGIAAAHDYATAQGMVACEIFDNHMAEIEAGIDGPWTARFNDMEYAALKAAFDGWLAWPEAATLAAA